MESARNTRFNRFILAGCYSQTPSVRDNEARIVGDRLWAVFCDALKDAGDQVLPHTTPADAINRAEGCRYLPRLLPEQA